MLTTNNHLPTELLLIIFNALTYDDLYQLTQVSPTFNHLALIVYFNKRRIPISPEGQADLPNPLKTMEMLPFLRKTPFITSFARFSCGLLQPHKSFLDNIQHIIIILKKVDSVEEFIIDFFVSSESWTPTMIKQANSRNALYHALRELFTTAAAVSRSVMVRNGTSLKSVLQKASDNYDDGGIPRSGRRKLSQWSLGPAVSRLFSSSDKLSKSSNSKTVTLPSPRAPIHSHHHPYTGTNNPPHLKGPLRVVEINTIILLSPPFLNWTIQTLNTNPIRALTFGTLEYRDVNWTTLLSRLDIPTLTTLTFRSYTPFYALIDFMSRHPGVTRLSINNINLDVDNTHNPITPQPTTTTLGADDLPMKLTKAFSNVKRLSCCPQGLVTLFSTASLSTTTSNTIINPTPFPNLQTISILWSIGIGQKLKTSIISNILSPIGHIFKSYKKLVFVITYRADSAGATWRSPALPLTRSPHHRHHHHLAGPLVLTRAVGFPRSILTTTTTATTSTGTPEANNINNTHTMMKTWALFSELTEIRLELSPRADREGIPDLIQRLAESLPNVRHFKVDSRSRAGRYPESRLPKAYLVYHILTQFRNLRTVSVDGTKCTYTTSSI